MAGAEPRALEPVVIEPVAGWVPLRLDELWRYRGLVYFLAWRDVKLQFKQTLLGKAWAVLQPLSLALVLSLVFGLLFEIRTGGVPHLLFFFTGLVPWTLFTASMTLAANSVVGNAHLIQKVYFPRLAIPLSAIVPAVVDFGFAGLVLAGMMLVYGVAPSPAIIFLPLFAALGLVVALGLGLWLCALNVRYRDVRYLVPLLQNLLFYTTPVFYSSAMLPEEWRWLFALNPMAVVVEGFRWTLLAGTPLAPGLSLVSALASLALVVSGAYYFRREEERFADEL